MKKTLLALAFVLSLPQNGSALEAFGLLCTRPDSGLAGGTNFYATFMTSATTLKEPITSVYQAVDKVLGDNIKAKCPSPNETQKMSQFLQEHRNLCVNECDKAAQSMNFSKRRFDHLRGECQTACRTDYTEQAMTLAGYGMGFKDGKTSCASGSTGGKIPASPGSR